MVEWRNTGEYCDKLILKRIEEDERCEGVDE